MIHLFFDIPVGVLNQRHLAVLLYSLTHLRKVKMLVFWRAHPSLFTHVVSVDFVISRPTVNY